MLQRIQTIYLILALVLTVVCLAMPVGIFDNSTTMEGTTTLLNLWKNTPVGVDYSVWPLFAVLLPTCPICVFAIFAYKSRKMQMKLCLFNVLLILVWIGLLVFFAYVQPGNESAFHPSAYAFFPVVALVLYLLARKGIKHDEKLIRDMDRIR